MTDDDPQLKAAQIFLSHFSFVEKQAAKLSPISGMASDIVHNVYIDFVRKAEHFIHEENIKPLLAGMVKIAALRLRQEYSKRLPPSFIAIAEKVQGQLMHQEDQDTDFEYRLKALYECMGQLSEKNRTIIEKHYFDKQTTANIAEEFQLTSMAVRQLLCRLREKLRSCIRKKCIAKNP